MKRHFVELKGQVMVLRDDASRLCVEITHASAELHATVLRGQPGSFLMRREQMETRLGDLGRKMDDYFKAVAQMNEAVADAQQEKEGTHEGSTD